MVETSPTTAPAQYFVRVGKILLLSDGSISWLHHPVYFGIDPSGTRSYADERARVYTISVDDSEKFIDADNQDPHEALKRQIQPYRQPCGLNPSES